MRRQNKSFLLIEGYAKQTKSQENVKKLLRISKYSVLALLGIMTAKQQK
jgi:hypothetical protein